MSTAPTHEEAEAPPPRILYLQDYSEGGRFGHSSSTDDLDGNIGKGRNSQEGQYEYGCSIDFPGSMSQAQKHSAATSTGTSAGTVVYNHNSRGSCGSLTTASRICEEGNNNRLLTTPASGTAALTLLHLNGGCQADSGSIGILMTNEVINGALTMHSEPYTHQNADLTSTDSMPVLPPRNSLATQSSTILTASTVSDTVYDNDMVHLRLAKRQSSGSRASLPLPPPPPPPPPGLLPALQNARNNSRNSMVVAFNPYGSSRSLLVQSTPPVISVDETKPILTSTQQQVTSLFPLASIVASCHNREPGSAAGEGKRSAFYQTPRDPIPSRSSPEHIYESLYDLEDVESEYDSGRAESSTYGSNGAPQSLGSLDQSQHTGSGDSYNSMMPITVYSRCSNASSSCTSTINMGTNYTHFDIAKRYHSTVDPRDKHSSYNDLDGHGTVPGPGLDCTLIRTIAPAASNLTSLQQQLSQSKEAKTTDAVVLIDVSGDEEQIYGIASTSRASVIEKKLDGERIVDIIV